MRGHIHYSSPENISDLASCILTLLLPAPGSLNNATPLKDGGRKAGDFFLLCGGKDASQWHFGLSGAGPAEEVHGRGKEWKPPLTNRKGVLIEGGGSEMDTLANEGARTLAS